jgi:aldose 1-epimerase
MSDKVKFPVAVDKVLIQDDRFEGLYKIALSNNYMSVELLNLGAVIYSINVPDHEGRLENIVLNYEHIKDYYTDKYYVGCTIGRMASRIAGGKMIIGAEPNTLIKNEGGRHHLHGGNNGVNKKMFEIVELTNDECSATVKFLTESPDMEEGYPGNLKIWITYKLHSNNSLEIIYQASTDKLTHVNLANHSYFNLSGKKRSALNQQLQITANHILLADHDFIPTGAIVDIRNSPHDFSDLRGIYGQKLKNDNAMFNECYLLENQGRADAILYDHETGRVMEVKTSYPGLIFYSGDHLGVPFSASQGVCLETQFFPDAPNQSYSESTLLPPKKLYHQTCTLSFFTMNDQKCQ